MPGPTHDLARVKEAVRSRRYLIREEVKNTACEVLCNTEEDIRICILALDLERDFYKTMPSERRPGRMQDVYKTSHPEIRAMPIYVKLDLTAKDILVVLSFKYDESPL